jgi:hypothetical protein
LVKNFARKPTLIFFKKNNMEIGYISNLQSNPRWHLIITTHLAENRFRSSLDGFVTLHNPQKQKHFTR